MQEELVTNNQPKFPSESPEYKRQKYLEQKARYKAQGLNARGHPFGGTKTRKMSLAMKKSWARRKAATQSAPAPESDIYNQSAQAIITAAQVLRSVAIGMRVGK